jgi:OOP family OmpA-OmpF porin
VAANKRFGELGDYNILGEVTVLFGNDKVQIEEQYKPQLLKLAQQAKGITSYIIQVKGYASKVGSAALNQRLSSERAENVTDFLEQQGQIPLTNILAPGAMGTSRQVAPDTSAEGQAENRRVVVRILQNKDIAGTQLDQSGPDSIRAVAICVAKRDYHQLSRNEIRGGKRSGC